MDDKQTEHNDNHEGAGKPFDPIAKLVVPDLAKLSQEKRDISYVYVIYALFGLGIFGLVPAVGGVIMAPNATNCAAQFISIISNFC